VGPGSCPLCGSDNTCVVRKDIEDPSPFQVRCLDCDCRGSRSSVRELALRHWEKLRQGSRPEEEGTGGKETKTAGDVRPSADAAR
jgi:hypothetical protein